MTIAGLARLGRALQTNLARSSTEAILRKRVQMMVRAIRVSAPRRTGRLAGSVTSETTIDPDGQAALTVRAGAKNAPYAPVIEYGNRARYPIPSYGNTTAKTLHFFWKGQEWFLPHVMRGKASAHPFFFPTVNRYRGRLTADLRVKILNTISPYTTGVR